MSSSITTYVNTCYLTPEEIEKLEQGEKIIVQYEKPPMKTSAQVDKVELCLIPPKEAE